MSGSKSIELLSKTPGPKDPRTPREPSSGPKPLKEERAETIKKPGTGKGK